MKNPAEAGCVFTDNRGFDLLAFLLPNVGVFGNPRQVRKLRFRFRKSHPHTEPGFVLFDANNDSSALDHHAAFRRGHLKGKADLIPDFIRAAAYPEEHARRAHGAREARSVVQVHRLRDGKTFVRSSIYIYTHFAAQLFNDVSETRRP